MNSCVLMAEIIQEPQLRYTADNLEIAEMLVQFPNSQRPEDPPATLKVVGWGNMAKEIQQNYHHGDQVIIVGRLGMNTIERPEGFKEKRAELTVQQIQSVGASFQPSSTLSVTRTPSSSENYELSPPAATSVKSSPGVVPQVKNPEPIYQAYSGVKQEEPDPDDIPF